MFQRSHFVPLRVSLVLTLLLLPFAWFGEREVLAQDQALRLLPRNEAVYLWTDDVPKVLDQLQNAAMDNDVVNRLWEMAEDQRRDRNATKSSSQNLFEKLELLTQLWTQLHKDQLLDGQAVLILPVDASSLDEPGSRGRQAPSITSFIFAARTHSTAEDFETFFATLATFSKRSTNSAPDEEEIHGEDKSVTVPGNWSVDGDWFCWTPTDVETLLTLDYLNGREIADQTLADDRNFQTVFKNLKSQLSSDHQVSIYATSGALPLLAWHTSEAFALANSLRTTSWKELFLDELRGFGARLYVNSPTFVDELRSPLAIDAFLLMTQPRRGVLGAVGDRNATGIQLDVPTLLTPIERFSQVVFEENGLYEGVVDVRKRAQALRPNQEKEEDASPPEDDPNALIFSVVSRFTEMTFAPRGDETAEEVDSRNILMAQTSDPERFQTLFTLMTDGSLVAKSPGQTDSPIDDLPEDEVVAWGRSEKSIADQRQRLLSDVARNEAQLQQLSRSNDRQSKQQSEQIRQLIAALQARLRQLDESKFESNLVMLRNWLMIWNFTNKENQQEVVDSYGSFHPQLIELEDNLQAMKTAFANSDNACGVVAFWADHLINRGQRLASRERRPSNAPNSVDEREPAANMTSEFLTAQVRQQIDKLLITMSSDDDGFRINAALLEKSHDDAAQDER